MAKPKPEIGSRVAFTRDACYGDFNRAQMRGTITAITEHTRDFILATVRWDGGAISDVNIRNLCTTKSVAFIESAAPQYPAI